MIRIFIADDHAIVRTGLRQIFEQVSDFEIVAEAADAHAVMEHVGRDAMDLLLLDLDMPGTTGVDLIQRVKARSPDLPILILSMHIEPGIALRAIKAGASGYVTKDCDLDILLPAIRKVAAGGTYIAPGMAEKMVFDSGPTSLESGFESLTDREMQVFALLFNGLGVNDIATQLAISNKTVSTHKVHLMEKLGVSSVADLIRYGEQHQFKA